MKNSLELLWIIYHLVHLEFLVASVMYFWLNSITILQISEVGAELKLIEYL